MTHRSQVWRETRTIGTVRHGGKVRPIRRNGWFIRCSCGIDIGWRQDFIDAARAWRNHRGRLA